MTPDRRVLRTQKALKSALSSLMLERGYENLTIQHIIDRAGVARSTFYAHFPDKESLLTSRMEDLRGWLLREWKAETVREKEAGDPFRAVLALIRHVDENRPFYLQTVGHESGAIIHRQMLQMLSEVVRNEFRHRYPDGPGMEARIQFVVGGFTTLAMWWLQTQPDLSEEQIYRIFASMVSI